MTRSAAAASVRAVRKLSIILATSLPVRRRGDSALLLDKTDDAVNTFALAQIGHDEGPRAAHALGVDFHLLQRGADMRRKIGLVDNEEVGTGDAGPALRWNFVAGRHVD